MSVDTKDQVDLEEQLGEMADKLAMIIKHYRKIRGYSLEDVYQHSTVSNSYVSRLERGERRSPTIAVLRRIAAVLQIPHDILYEIIFGEKAPNQRVLTLEEVLICEEYQLNGVLADREFKESLVDVIKYVLTCEWSPETKMRDSFNLSELIDQLKLSM